MQQKANASHTKQAMLKNCICKRKMFKTTIAGHAQENNVGKLMYYQKS